ncbi:MAG: hypothetical protein JEZ14_06980 [Marinilabiliaceae bacterium]|nr:hypothetical protein [Marinilabiliaceae bacterium]
MAQDYVLSQLKTHGIKAVHGLDGSFYGHYIDVEKNEMYVFNDRLGMIDLFLMQHDTDWAITENYWQAVQAAPSKTINELAIEQLLRFGYMHFKHTYINEVQLCDPATIITIDLVTNRIKTIQAYWKHQPEPTLHDEEKVLAELADAIETGVVESFNEVDATYATANSGGLDSRWNMFYACRHQQQFKAYTYAGRLRSDAVHVASKVNRHLDVSDAMYIPVEINEFLPKYTSIQMENNPMLPLYSTWYYSAYRSLLGVDININGFASTFFDAFTYKDGAHDNERYWKVAQYDKYQYCYDLYNETEEGLIHKVYRSPRNTKLKDSFFAELDQFKMTGLGDLCDTFDFYCRQRRLNKNEPWTSFYGAVQARSPIMHHKAVDLSLKMSFELRNDRYLYKKGAEAAMGKLAAIRFERSPLGLNHHSHLTKQMKELIWRADMKLYKKFGFAFGFKGDHKNVAQWMLMTENWAYLQETFSSGNELFNERFNQSYIVQNLEALVKRDFVFVTSLLAVFLFFKHLEEGVL